MPNQVQPISEKDDSKPEDKRSSSAKRIPEDPNIDRVVGASPQNKLFASTDDDNQDGEPGFDIYARPYIPEIFTVINTLPGMKIFTNPKKEIDFQHYVATGLGLAAGFFPQPATLSPPATGSWFRYYSDISSGYYEGYFRFHIDREAGAQRREDEKYSCKQHLISF